MANNKLKRWARQRPSGAGEPKQERSGGEAAQLPAEAPADSATVRHVFAVTASDADPATDDPAGAASADLDEVGAEVGTVLKSAQEAAERIRRAAHEEASKMREEAEAAAAAEVEEGRRLAEGDREDARRIRKEADDYAEKVRADAERESGRTLEKARLRLERADQAIAEKLREAEGKARHRREALKAESERYRARLENMLRVFHGMSSQLEELLSEKTTREERESTDEPAEETLEDSLRRTATYRSA